METILMKYAIRIPFDGDQLVPALYDSKEEAEQAASIWDVYEVVEYNES
jgi:hypothetical protein